MKVFRFPDNNPPQISPSSVVALGNFDGLHRGHQALLNRAADIAGRKGIESFVFSFEPHPVKILRPQTEIQTILSLEEKAFQLQSFGIDGLILQDFTKELSEISAFDFFEFHLLIPLAPKVIVVGHDFAFGKNREGNVEWFKKHCKDKGIELIVVDKVDFAGERVSSQRVREALVSGDLKKANSLLGFPFFVRGEVEHGDGRGRTIGIPTANLKIHKKLFIPNGVYATRVHGPGFQARGVTNIGVRPTFGPSGDARVETHLLDNFKEDLYGKTLTLELLGFIRPEKKFSDVNELKRQIHLDIESASSYS